MAEERLIKEPSSIRELALGMMAYTSGSIIGPLLLFAVPGYLIDSHFGTKPFALLVSIFLAFVTTNFLIFKKIKKLVKKFDEFDKKKSEAQNEENKI